MAGLTAGTFVLVTRPIVVALALLAACYQPNFVEGLACTSRGDCPPDQRCAPSENRCYLTTRFSDGGGLNTFVDAFEGPDAPTTGVTCNPLTQTGCAANQKCTWLIDLADPYTGHIGCAPTGAAFVGDTCTFGAPGPSGYDNCAKGLVCGAYRGTAAGQCKAICDTNGGAPQCDASHACSTYSGLFSTSGSTVVVGGLCDTLCNPLTDNDFDGTGSISSKSTTACGFAEDVGCYGSPSFGTAPVTVWSCTNDVAFDSAQPLGLRHRVACSEANGCAAPGPTYHTNSCNQGYIPLLLEQTGSTQTICVAICKPAICYSGNCGSNNTNRNGDPASMHQCTTAHRLGTFAATEHCLYSWAYEIDDTTDTFLPSPTSDTVGFCTDLAKYRFDSNADGQVNTNDAFYPNCDTLGSGVGTGTGSATTFFGAADLGCVPSSFRPALATGKGGLSPEALRKRAALNLPRTLYHRTSK